MGQLSIDAKTTALVVIDLQKGIVGLPTEPRKPAEVVGNARRLAEALREKGGFVALVRVSFAPDGKDWPHPECDQPMTGGQRPADWDQIVPEMGPKPGDHVVVKRQWGAFYGTDLDLQLRRRGIRTIILCGIATSIGVESTARGAYEHGYEQVFAEDAMSSLSAADHEHSIRTIFPRIGRVRSTTEIVAAIR